MTVPTSSRTDASPLATWATRQRKLCPQRFRPNADGLRFAFYGRISTADHQDHGSSRHWQLAAATDLITGHGSIVASTSTPACPGGSPGRTGRTRPLLTI